MVQNWSDWSYWVLPLISVCVWCEHSVRVQLSLTCTLSCWCHLWTKKKKFKLVLIHKTGPRWNSLGLEPATCWHTETRRPSHTLSQTRTRSELIRMGLEHGQIITAATPRLFMNMQHSSSFFPGRVKHSDVVRKLFRTTRLLIFTSLLGHSSCLIFKWEA